MQCTANTPLQRDLDLPFPNAVNRRHAQARYLRGGVDPHRRRVLADPAESSFPRLLSILCVRFFLVLVLFNAPWWFRDPLCARQFVSWLFLLISVLLPAHGFYLLWTVGRPKGEIERTMALVTVGIYKHIRHPRYASLLYGACGVFLKDPSLPGGVLAPATGVSSFLTARAEDTEMLLKFGADYATYMKRTMRFVPFVF